MIYKHSFKWFLIGDPSKKFVDSRKEHRSVFPQRQTKMTTTFTNDIIAYRSPNPISLGIRVEWLGSTTVA